MAESIKVLQKQFDAKLLESTYSTASAYGNDIDAAIAAGIPVIGVPFGYTPIPIHDLGANVVVDHFDDLIEALVELL